MKRYWQHIVNSTEQRVEDFLAGQVRDESRPDHGRLESGVVEGKPTVYLLTDCLCLYFCEDSRFYKSEELFRAICRGVSFVERWQREDGSMDYPSCNFYSAPDTAFCFRRLYGAWEILKIYGGTEKEKELQARYLRLMTNCAPILLHGGFHTPNHRWAVMSALLVLADLMETESHPEPFCGLPGMVPKNQMETESHSEIRHSSPDWVPENKTEMKRSGTEKKELITPALLRARAAQYRNEGIDCDEDGEYAERSAGNYNAVADKCLMQACEVTGDERFAEYVERNLTAMLFYIDGDGTVFTENSTRQDQGKRLYPDSYFYLYTWMAEKTGSDVFDAAAHKIIRDNRKRGDQAPDCMYIFMTHERMRNYVFRGCGYPEEYRRFFRGSEVLRVQNRNFGYSVRNHREKFLFMKFRSLTLWMRIGEAYCDIRHFIPARMETSMWTRMETSMEAACGDGSCVPEAEAEGGDISCVPEAEVTGGDSSCAPEAGAEGGNISGALKAEAEGRGISCTLEAETEGWYYEPFAEKPATADWWKMDHAKRERVITSRLKTGVVIRELANGLEIKVKTEGLSGLPLRLEIGIPAGCVLEHDAFRLTAQAGESLILKQGMLRVTDGGTQVEIGPGFGTHAFDGHYSGETKNMDGFSVFLNDYTPCERTVRVVAKQIDLSTLV